MSMFNLLQDLNFRLTGRNVLGKMKGSDVPDIYYVNEIIGGPRLGTYKQLSDVEPHSVTFEGHGSFIRSTNSFRSRLISTPIHLAQWGVLDICNGYRDGLIGSYAIAPKASRQFKYGYKGKETHKLVSFMDFLPQSVVGLDVFSSVQRRVGTLLKNVFNKWEHLSITDMYREAYQNPDLLYYLTLMESKWMLTNNTGVSLHPYILLAHKDKIPNRTLSQGIDILDNEPLRFSITLSPQEILVRGPVLKKGVHLIKVRNTYPVSVVCVDTGKETPYGWTKGEAA